MFGKDKLEYAHMAVLEEGTVLYRYSYFPKGNYFDETSLEKSLIILSADT